MKFKKKIMVLALFGLFIMMIFSGINLGGITEENSAYREDNSEENYYKEEIQPKNSGSWSTDYIHIFNDNWSASGAAWIQDASGTLYDPHIIENVTIDATGRAWGILIENSEENFIIRNCTIYNAGVGSDSGALKLVNTQNGVLENNNISNNNENGIWLENYCKNIVVRKNEVNLNGQNGIRVNESCDYNSILSNTLTSNSQNGLRIRYRCHNNTIISNNASNNNDNGIYIGDDCDDNTIENNIVNDNMGYSGIWVEINSDSNIIKNNTVNSNTQDGIRIQGNLAGNDCYYTQVLDNHLESNQRYGMYVYGNIHNSTISGNIILSSVDYGIYTVNHCTFNTITKNTISLGNSHGIGLAAYRNGTVSRNRLENNQDDGINLLANNEDSTIYGNLLRNNQRNGIRIQGGISGNTENLLYFNSFINNLGGQAHDNKNPGDNSWDNGIYGNYWDNHTTPDDNNDLFVDAPYTWITGNANSIDNHPLMNSTAHYGERIHIDASGVSAWKWDETAKFKVWCTGSGTFLDPYIIDNLEINGGGTDNGILIENSNDYFIIKNCKVYNAGTGLTIAGIKLRNTNNGTLTKNDCSNNGRYGILLINDCYNNTILGNIANNNLLYGIGLYDNCNNNTISENTASNVGTTNQNTGIYLFDNCNNNTISGNTANNNTVCGINLYYYCINNNISGNIANNNTQIGIYLRDYCDNNIISGNNITYNDHHGIYLTKCYNNRVIKNEIKYNDWYGMYIASSNESFIFDNNITNNGQTGDYSCIYLYDAHLNNITGNRITNNTNEGIEFFQSDNNTITRNDIFFNGVGLNILTDSNNNTIYLNYFRNNTNHAIDDGTGNMWDNGVIGNYWDNHTGPDNDKNCIVDIPYTWIAGSAGTRDNFPLMPCWPPSPPSGAGGGSSSSSSDDDTEGVIIPGYNIYILIGIISIVSIVLIKKRRK